MELSSFRLGPTFWHSGHLPNLLRLWAASIGSAISLACLWLLGWPIFSSPSLQILFEG